MAVLVGEHEKDLWFGCVGGMLGVVWTAVPLFPILYW